MPQLMESLQFVDDFAVYLVLALALLVVSAWLYDKVTPYDELALIRAGNTAAAISYSGAVIGLALPLASAVEHSVNPVDMVIWGVVALGVQVLVFFLVRRMLPQINAQIPEATPGPASLLAGMAIGAGIVNAACLTY